MELDLLWIAVFFALFYFYLEKKLGDIKQDLLNQYYIMESVLGKQSLPPAQIAQETQQEQPKIQAPQVPQTPQRQAQFWVPPRQTDPESVVPTLEELDHQPTRLPPSIQDPIGELVGYDGKIMYASFTI